MSTTVHIVNAFTANETGGNPAGVVLDADELSGAEMQAITTRVGLSDMAFVCKSEYATYQVRFFTVAREIDLCGHATIATWSLLYTQGMVAPGEYTQETLAGLLAVTITDDGLVFMQQAKAAFYSTVPTTDIAPLLGITPEDINSSLTPQIVSTGIHDLFVAVKDKGVLGRLRPNLPAITAFSEKQQISAIHTFCLLDTNGGSVVAARNFAPIDGIDEEAATGTSNGALLCYLKKYNHLPERASYRIEQGEAMHNLSYIYGRFVDGIVWIGGKATLVRDELQ